LSKSIIDRDFNLSINASVSHAVQFISTKGEVLYELVSDPVPVVSLTSSTARFSSSAQAVYRTNSYREGWAVHADGSIEIQARALADLDTVRYIIKPESATFESSFGLSSDLRWRSLITHAYRKYSIKVASEAEELRAAVQGRSRHGLVLHHRRTLLRITCRLCDAVRRA
jgi:hypothetical protein